MRWRNELPEELHVEVSQKGLRQLRRYKYAVLQLYVRRVGRDRILDFLVDNGCSPELARWVIAEALKEDMQELRTVEEEAFEDAQKELVEKPIAEVLARLSLSGAVLFFTYVLMALFWQNVDSNPVILVLLPVLYMVMLAAVVYLIWGATDVLDRYADWKRRRRNPKL